MAGKVLQIDGAFGEGGGQILRTTLSLAALTGTPVRIVNIRAGRKKPGLMPQHLAAVRAAAAICNAKLMGDALHSSSLSFTPARMRAGRYRFAIGTAGATSLVLQTLIWPLAFAEAPSVVEISGGTHVPFAPVFDYLQQVFLPALGRMGIHADAELIRLGFYPRGGGMVRCRIKPACGPLVPLACLARGPLQALHITSVAANLPHHIVTRQARRAQERIAATGIQPTIREHVLHAASPGTYVFLHATYENVFAGFSALGARGKPAEAVADEAVAAYTDYVESDAALDVHLADQILIGMALATGTSKVTLQRSSRHLQTNMEVIRRLLGVRLRLKPDEPCRLDVDGKGFDPDFSLRPCNGIPEWQSESSVSIRMIRILRDYGLHFAAPGLLTRAIHGPRAFSPPCGRLIRHSWRMVAWAGCAPLAANHSDGYAFCLHARPAHAHPAPSIHDLMKNPGFSRR